VSEHGLVELVRSVQIAEYVKRLHDWTCDRGYSEAAHIRPLGRPHAGPDVLANVLSLCPNCSRS
jgi:putative restriction endonuclease